MTWMTNHLFLVPAMSLAALIFIFNLLTSRLERAFKLRRQEPVVTEASLAQSEAAAASLSNPFTLVDSTVSLRKEPDDIV